MRSAFTIIEIFVSVMIISVVVLGIAKIEEKNISIAKYIGYRSSNELENSLFFALSNDNLQNDRVDAYSAISKLMSIKKEEIKNTLKDIERNVTISDPLTLEQEDLPIDIKIRALMLKDKYPSRYYLLDIGKPPTNNKQKE